MSEALAKMARARRRGRVASLPVDERRALHRMRVEAAARGAVLRTSGVGGIPASLALGTYRRDGWRCKRCGGTSGLSLHHKGGASTARRWLGRGKRCDYNNLVVLCGSCHDAVHDEARAQEE